MTELVPYFILEKDAEKQSHGSFLAYTMFIDIVGFTELTSSLMEKGTIGAEQLSDTLNKLFTPLIDIVYEHGGSIPYFAGDAFLAFFQGENSPDNIREIFEVALEIQQFFTETKDPDLLDIAIKIGLSHGNIDWGIIQATENKKTYYFKGHSIDKATQAQLLAKGGEVIISKEIAPDTDQIILEEVDQTYAKLMPQKKKLVVLKRTPSTKPDPELIKQSVGKFVPDQIIDYQLKGEFREVVSIFISFKGIEAYEDTNVFFSRVLILCTSFSGYFKEIDYSDKGGVIVILFGAPTTFENNVERALEFLLSLKEEQEQGFFNAHLKFKGGITIGLSFTGLLGGAYKKQYVALGNHVNIAARLMSASSWGEFSATKEIAKNKGFVFTKKGKIKYKGIEKSISTYKLESKSAYVSRFSGNFIGRANEESKIIKFLKKNTLKSSKPAFIKIYGEAGIGKSRLLHEVEQKIAKKKKVRWHTCQADQILKKPFNPIIYFLKEYFGQKPNNDKETNEQIFEETIKKFIAEFYEKKDFKNATEIEKIKPIFAALLGFKTKNTLWEELDARARFNSIIKSTVYIFKTISLEEKLIVEFEDLHWFDESTMAFVQKLIEDVDDSPIAIICTSRYDDDGSKPVIIDNETLDQEGFAHMEIDLNQLDQQSILEYTEKKLRGNVSSSFLSFLVRTTNGNPFYLEQILAYLRESNLVLKVEGEWMIKDEEISISNSINSVLMARVDRLSERVKETVKTAAVIGREFEIPILNEVMKTNLVFQEEKATPALLEEQIKVAERGQIWRAVNELKYIFKHSLLREAVYNMQLKSNLRDLHSLIGNAIELLHKDRLEERFVDLAFHFEEAEKHNKAIFYMKKAADYARKNFQNKRALMYYSKVKAYLDRDREKEDYAKILLRESEILELIGQWNESLDLLRQANTLAEHSENEILIGRTKNQLGKLLVLQGNYSEAKYVLETAMQIFTNFNDEIGLFKAYGNLGDLFFRQADYDNARAYFEKSISMAKDFKDTFTVTQIVSNLGLTYMNQSLYEKAIGCQLEQLALCEVRGDRNGMAILNTNIGIVYSEIKEHSKALPYYEKGYELSHDLGNKQMEAIAIGCLGNIYEERGNYDKALELYTTDLKLCKELGDKRGIAIVNGMLGELLLAKGEFEAAEKYLKDQLSFSEELQYQKGITKALISLAENYMANHFFEEAKAPLLRCIALSDKIGYLPSFEESYSLLIDSYIELGDLEAANNALTTLKAHPELEENAGLKLRTAKLLIAGKKNEEAKPLLLEVISKDKNEFLLAEAHVLLFRIEQSHKKKATDFISSLYVNKPHHFFKLRLNELKGA